MSQWDYRGSNSDVFYPDEDKKPASPASKSTMQGLEHILHSRAVRPPSQSGGRLPSEGRGRPPSVGNLRPHRDDRDWQPRDRDPRDSRPRDNRPSSREYEPPKYESRSPRDGSQGYPRLRDDPARDDRRPRDSRPSRDHGPPRDRDHNRSYDGRDPRPRDHHYPPRYESHYNPRDDRPTNERSRTPNYVPRRNDPYWPSGDDRHGLANNQDNKDLSLRVDKSTDALTPDSKDSYKPKEWNKPEKEEMTLEEETKRETWGHKAEFILATIGLAVGLGNVWRFPYLCQKNGGGAFLIPYVIFMLIEGLPLFFLELSIGQRMRKSAILCWRDIHPCLFGIGVGCLMVSLMLCLYYVIVIAWCCYYFFISFTSNLPWKKETLCHNWPAYNSILQAISACESGANPNCTTNSTLYKTLKSNESTFPDCCVRDPPQYYFYHHALQISTNIEDPGIGINVKLFGCLIFAWIITYLCVVKGIKSSGKVVYFTATFPYIILIILFFRGVTLEGAGEGLKTFFTPKWDLLLDANIWKDAATQMFFTLSLGFGALIAFASYMPIHNQVMRDAYTVVFVNCGTSLFAGIVVFSILGYRQTKTGIPADKVGSGPGLAFMTFSDAMLLMEVSPLWAILFFFMLILLGIDSEFGTLEAAIGPIMDLKLFPKVRKEFITLILAVVLFLFGISMVSGPGFYIFQIFDDYSVTIPLLVIALFQCIGVAWVYGNNRFADDIEFMTGKRPWVGWMICWKYISPTALFVVLVALVVQQAQKAPTYSKYVGCEQKPFGDSPGTKDWTVKEEYPGWAVFLIVVIVLVSTVPILIWLIKDWPKNSARSFHKMFCTGLNNYAPDPKRDPSDQQQRNQNV